LGPARDDDSPEIRPGGYPGKGERRITKNQFEGSVDISSLEGTGSRHGIKIAPKQLRDSVHLSLLSLQEIDVCGHFQRCLNDLKYHHDHDA
jgi:hypothetical protein